MKAAAMSTTGSITTPLRVALVEDDAVLHEALASLFAQDQGFSLVAAFRDAEQAIEQLPVAPPDLVIMDIGLPGRTGIECVRELAPRMPGTQFLIYTTHDDDQRVFDALRAGAHGYILKSSTPDEILDALRELHGGGAPMSTTVARLVVNHFRPGPPRPELAHAALSEREQLVLGQLAKGLLYKEIGARLGISESTVRQHIHHIYQKLHVSNRTEAVNRYFGR